MIFLAVFASLSVVLYTSSSLHLRSSDNHRKVQSAQMAAESGLGFMLLCLRDVDMPSTTTGESLIANLTTSLGEALNGTANLAGHTVATSGGGVEIPNITVEGVTFSSRFAMEADGQKCRLTVTGSCQGVSRSVAVSLGMTEKSSGIFDYAIASRGKIQVGGNATVTGMNTPGEGSVLSMSADPVAIQAGGHATIGGDLYVTNPDETSVQFTGGALSVAGESDTSILFDEHVHFGVEEPPIPEFDLAPFSAMTTSTIDAETELGGGDLVLTNVRIMPNTNPTFSSDTVINGVLYIESPNDVQFTGGATINGIIIADNRAASDIVNNQLKFVGHVSAPGVDALPDTPQFAAIKEQTGTILLAPGFGVTIGGNTNTINGMIAADQFKFSGSANIAGDMTGSIIGLADKEMVLNGNTTIRINRQGADDTPAGFKHPIALVPIADSYAEGPFD